MEGHFLQERPSIITLPSVTTKQPPTRQQSPLSPTTGYKHPTLSLLRRTRCLRQSLGTRYTTGGDCLPGPPPVRYPLSEQVQPLTTNTHSVAQALAIETSVTKTARLTSGIRHWHHETSRLLRGRQRRSIDLTPSTIRSGRVR